ncbi:aminopeptidase N [Saccharobesus litoralis]|uniref:Aminopeptidase N n=1 Tax=Saccharobesus litoralis TaxID=2172099 RepID=A0A2S0VU38_9ALTE|nr:aminopeptidase N [Saccharobesus litoralis]AWB67731.1 aminopeptidase N [Saccharobesus litoralis]
MKTENANPQAKYLKDYRSPAFLVKSVELTIELDDHKTKVISVVDYVKNEATTSLEPNVLVLDGEQQNLLQVSLNGQVLTPEQYQLSDTNLCLEPGLASFQLIIESEIDPANNTSLEGLYKSGGVFCTQCEAEGFRKITYYQDRPDVLATFTTHIIGDPKQYPFMLSNGNKVNEQSWDNETLKVTWQDPHPKPAYLFALVAGDLDVLRDNYTTKSGREVKLELFVDKGNLHRAPFAMQSLQRSMLWDEERFGLEYDLDIYMIVAVDFFNMGAMENKGLNVFNSKCVLADPNSATDNDYLMIESIVGHEYFHNWTGNRVTCRDWFQLSLKEGLTVFRDQEFSMDLGSRAVNRIQQVKVMRSHQFAEDAGPMSHPIRPESVIEQNNFYTVTVYDKGAEVIRMMHSILGEQGFQNGMRLYFERHDGQAVTCDDFVAAMQDANKEAVDLSLFKRWYSQSGTPSISVVEKYDAQQKRFSITLSQLTKPTADQPNKLPLHIPVNIALFSQQGQVVSHAEQHVLNLTQDSQTFEFENIDEQPYVSYLRDFSAPVQLNYQYSDQALATLLAAESSGFAKWELAQTWFIQQIKAKITDKEFAFSSLLVSSLAKVITDQEADLLLVAEILKLPSVATILADFEQIDIDEIISARDAFTQFLAAQLKSELRGIIERTAPKAYEFSAEQIASRAIRNAALMLLAYNTDCEVAQIEAQFANADNMTDVLGALGAASIAQSTIADNTVFNRLMKEFETKWTGDSLVMDKWLSLNATHESDCTLAHLAQLEKHQDFTMQNPNRVRALIGAFAMNNPKAFHSKDGAGYQYLANKLIELNAINPQVAARLITPLIQFKNLDDSRQVLIKGELERIAQTPDLSKDLYEKITKALA